MPGPQKVENLENGIFLSVKILSVEIFVSFRGPSGRFLEGFWGYVELKACLGSSLQPLLLSEVDFLTSTHPILEGFGDLLEKILDIFWYLFAI